MDTFFKVVTLVTAIAGAQILNPEGVCATVQSNTQISSQQESPELLLSAKGWQPPDNGGPDDSGQGAGTR